MSIEELNKSVYKLSLNDKIELPLEKVNYILPEYPIGYASTHFILEGYEIDEIIHLFNTYLKKYKFQFTNHPYKVYWYVHTPNQTNQDFTYGYFLIKLYKSKNDYIVDVYKLFGTDELYQCFYDEIQSLFR